MIRIAVEDPDQAPIRAMLAAGEAESAALYPAESNHHLPLDALRAPDVLFHVARDVDGTVVGTGAVVLRGEWAEIKRMWTDPASRGRGIAARLLDALQDAAARRGVRALRLETGVRSDAALALYRRAGFVPIGPFEGYGPDPLSVFLEKRLAV